MSNGPDLPHLIGAYDACKAARRDIRERQADEASAKGHFEQAHTEAQNEKKAETPADKFRHHLEATKEKNKGKAASENAEKNKENANKHIGQYHAKMGHDPTTPPALGKDGPNCKPVEDAITKKLTDATKAVTDALRKAGQKI
jgi:hypothetical protein